ERYAGKCNWFCCNCDGSCVTLKKRSISEGDYCFVRYSLSRFTAADSNGDGVISESEGRDYLMNGTSSVIVKRYFEKVEWFASIDRNADGFIQPGEFDESLV
ncbi:hypothetical protein PMAYCL1PPCAC_13691, partial [Pristionchus mayeri]